MPTTVITQFVPPAASGGPHTHVIAEVTGLQVALDAKAATAHTHVASDVTNFSTAVINALGDIDLGTFS